MKRISVRTITYPILDILLLACCLLRIPDLRTRALAPFDVIESGDSLVVSSVLSPDDSKGIGVGDVVMKYDGQRLRTEHDIEFLTDFKAIGERVPVTYTKRGDVAETTVSLIPYFNLLYLAMVLGVGVTTIVMALYLVYKRPHDITAAILHWSFVSLGVVVIVAWEGWTPWSILSSVNGILFFASYAGVATMFLLFTTMFPRPKFGPVAAKAAVICLPAAAILVPLLVRHQEALATGSLSIYGSFQDWFDLFHAVLILYVITGVLTFIHSYVIAGSQEERKKLKWILFGLSIGPLPFLLSTVLPIMVAPRYIVPEHYTLAFLIAIPASFAISFFRYHLLDIDLVINRATVYTVVIGTMLGVYVIVIAIAAGLVGLYAEASSILAAVIVALLFQPARTWVQRFIDQRFFRVHYNFREAVRRYVEDIKRCLDARELAELVVEETCSLIPVERIGFFVIQRPQNRLQLLAQRNLSAFENPALRSQFDKVATCVQLPVGISERLEPGIRHDVADRALFRNLGLALVFPMLSKDFEMMGFLALGEKKSGSRFGLEDADLLASVTVQAGLAIERLQLQTELLLEQAEAQRLEELNRIKSDFVSYVSHELRTPLTSIKMFAELLERRLRPGERKAKDYLTIIEGESDRLDRMVTNVLDSARIEQGVKEYTLVPADLQRITDRVMTVMKYQLDSQRFRVVYRRGRRPVRIMADPDAIVDAIINLIGNAIKYSAARKYIAVSLVENERWAICSVKDRGVGISRDALPHLFERFYRDPSSRHSVEGVGLGLPLVKHIVDAHGGSVDVESTPRKGSTFTLKFPLLVHRHAPTRGHRLRKMRTDS
jgi:signal transduction histidine kinase